MSTTNPPTLITTQVTIAYRPGGDGNSSDGYYQIVCTPAKIAPHTGDAIICYQLVGAIPPGIVFAGFDQSSELQSHQLSAPSISQDGTLMTIIDSDSIGDQIFITLRFKNLAEILFDPQIGNNPTHPS